MSMFANAKTEAAKKPAKKKGPEKAVFDVQGIRDISTIDAIIAALSAARTTLELSVKERMFDIFVETGSEIGRKPESFRGIDEGVEASCEIRKRSTRSVLSEDDVILLQENNIPFEEIIDQKEAFLINPDYSNDSELLERVSKALENVPGMPKNFIKHQAEIKRNVASDETVDAVFKSDNVSTLMPVVTVLALKVAAPDVNLHEALKMAGRILGTDEE